jgi:hypothetical protein
MRNISDERCKENQNTHFLFSNVILENRTVYEIMWKNIVEPGRPQMVIWRLRIVFWIPKATNTHTGCVIIIAFPLQQRLHERASVLRYTNVPQCYVTRTRLSVTLHVHCMSCKYLFYVQ